MLLEIVYQVMEDQGNKWQLGDDTVHPCYPTAGTDNPWAVPDGYGDRPEEDAYMEDKGGLKTMDGL